MKKIQKSKVKKMCLVLAVLIVVAVGTLAILPVFSPKVEAGARWGIWIEWWFYGVDLSHCGGSTAINCVVIWP